MNKFIIFTTLLFTGFLTAQISENREVAGFSKLKVSSSIAVSYTISDQINVKVETDDAEKMKLIKTEIVNGTLILSVDTEDYKKNKNKAKNKKKDRNRSNVSFINGVDFQVLKITISGPNLEAIKASSSAFVKMQNVNKSDNLDIAVSSSGTIKGNFECNSLNIQASSSGEFVAEVAAKSAIIESSSSSTVTLEGKASNLNVKVSSSGDCNLQEFRVENAIVSASSSGSVNVHTSKSIEAKASSSGSISFYGNPTNVSKEMSSSGSVTKR